MINVALSSMAKKLFGWSSSSKKCDKLLVTDAALLDDTSRNNSTERIQSTSLSISPLSPETGLSRFDSQNMSVMRTNDLMAEPSNALSIRNNTQQNIYQFSHINGLHIGSSVQITNNSKPSPERRCTAGVAIPKTRSIDGESLYTFYLNNFLCSIVLTTLTLNLQL